MPYSRLRSALTIAPLLLTLAPAAAHAQDNNDFSGNRRNFVFVYDKTLSVNGSWESGSVLQTYAHAHPGRYIVFEQGKALYRLDDSRALDEVERIYAPMAALDEQQHALAAQQRPLAEQQHALAAQQKAAEGNPSEQGRIGAEQGRIGQQQGEIGSKQGEVGQHQGEVGRAFYGKVISLINTCLARNTCRRVQP